MEEKKQKIKTNKNKNKNSKLDMHVLGIISCVIVCTLQYKAYVL